MSDWLHPLISSHHQVVRSLRREVLDATPKQWRLAADTLARLYPTPKNAAIRKVREGEVEREEIHWIPSGSAPATAPVLENNEWATDQSGSSRPIVWLHGGGFAFGSPRTHRAAAIAVARATSRPVWLVDYPLAPEHPYPHALGALETLHLPHALDIVGDSAGGNLALAWALRRKKKDRLVLLSPWLDLRVNSLSAQQNHSGHSAFDREDLREYASLYLAGANPTLPDCSPVLADTSEFTHLKSVLLESSKIELLRGDSVLLAAKCQEAQIPCIWEEEPSAHHGWQLFPDWLPEAKRSLERIRNFLAQP